jgi:hypothetical protein
MGLGLGFEKISMCVLVRVGRLWWCVVWCGVVW